MTTTKTDIVCEHDRYARLCVFCSERRVLAEERRVASGKKPLRESAITKLRTPSEWRHINVGAGFTLFCVLYDRNNTPVQIEYADGSTQPYDATLYERSTVAGTADIAAVFAVERQKVSGTSTMGVSLSVQGDHDV